jgi:predicted molibdopterin-dependent oxidoreductase YjgC
MLLHVLLAESDLELSKCIECGQCVSVCPVGALSEKTSWRQVLQLLQSKRKVSLYAHRLVLLSCFLFPSLLRCSVQEGHTKRNATPNPQTVGS